MTLPLYSLSTAHANDRADLLEMTELNASLLFLYGIGAIVAPLIASALIAGLGPSALFGMIAVAHGVLILFGLWRMTRRPSARVRTA